MQKLQFSILKNIAPLDLSISNAVMRSQGFFLLCILSLVTLVAGGTKSVSLSVVQRGGNAAAFNRSLFPSDFVFGIGSSAYQVLVHHHITIMISICNFLCFFFIGLRIKIS